MKSAHSLGTKGKLCCFLLGLISFSPSYALAGTNKSSTGDQTKGVFVLTKGAGIAVCDAYLERLNSTKYDSPPFCDRPENDNIKGFSWLNRVSLSPNDVHDLYPIIRTFVSKANNRAMDWGDKKLQQKLTQSAQFYLTPSAANQLKTDLDNGWAKMWRYDPPLDIDNDGNPDNVELWQGTPVRGVGGRRCGTDMSDEYPGQSGLLRQPQLAFVVSTNNDRLDVVKTNKIFAHPMGGYPLLPENGKPRFSSDFRPIGKSIGIFEYQGLYYFDTFFDAWGDFEGERVTVGTGNKDIQISNTLAVFLHENGKTRQVCEYLMKGNAIHNEPGMK